MNNIQQAPLWDYDKLIEAVKGCPGLTKFWWDYKHGKLDMDLKAPPQPQINRDISLGPENQRIEK